MDKMQIAKDIELPLLSQTPSIKYSDDFGKQQYHNCNFISQFLFTWVSPFIQRAQTKAFEQDQHYDLRKEDQSNSIARTINSEWEKHKKDRFSLLRTLYATFKSRFWLSISFALLQICIDFTNPLLVSKIVNYDSNPEKSIFYGLLLITAFLVARLGSITVNSQAASFTATLQNKVMTGSQTLMLQKSFRFALMQSQEYSAGSIMNHLLVDCENVGRMFAVFPQLVQFPFILVMGITVLYFAVGFAFVGGIAAILFIAFCITLVSRKLYKHQSEVMRTKDIRVKKTNEILTGIKYIKMCGLENEFLKDVSQNRDDELFWINKKNMITVIRIFFFWLSPILLSISVLGCYVMFNGELTAQKAFVVLSTLMIVQIPISMIGQVMSDFLQGQVSVTRVEKFMSLQDLETKYIKINNNSDSEYAFRIENGTFHWNEPSKPDTTEKELTGQDEPLNDKQLPILTNIMMNVKKRSFVAILGEVGSGKSSLLNSLLGEMKVSDENPPVIEINGSVAYVSQKPWILNATIKDNVLFSNEYNKERYLEALKASCLQRDLEILIKQDETEIGEKGVNLSGGQKARIALARAIYAKSDIYLLDDPLSAVDAHVSQHIVEQCLLKSLQNSTRVLVTHHVELLHYVDYIYILQDGQIVQQGTYNEIRETPQYQEIARKANNEPDSEQQPDQQSDQDDTPEIENIRKKSSMISSRASIKREGSIVSRKQSSVYEPQKDQDNLMLTEDRQVGSIGLDVWMSFFHYFGGWPFFIALIITISLWVGLKSASDMWLAHWSSSNVGGEGNHGNGYYFGIYAMLGLAAASLTFFRIGMVMLKSIKVSDKLHKNMFQKVIRAPLNLFFDRIPLGRLLNRFTGDLGAIDDPLPLNLGGLFQNPINLIARVTILAIAGTFWVFPLALTFLAIGFKIQQRYLNIYRECIRLQKITASPVISLFGESLDGLTHIRSAQAQNKFFKKYYDKQDEFVKNQTLIVGLQGWFTSRINFTSLLVTGPVLTAAILFSDNLSSYPGFIGLLFTYLMEISTLIMQTLQQVAVCEGLLISFERCRALTTVEIENHQDRGASSLPNYSYRWPERGQIEFKNYSAKYRPNLPNVVKNVSFKIGQSEKIGVVGRTGSGKSTLLLCLLRIIESHRGQIFIDGIDISKLSLDTLRRKITIIPQDPLLYKGTLKNNLDLFGQYSDAQIWNALDKVCMKAKFEQFGLNTEIKEGGDNLSVGEKQLLCIARAILNKTKIVLIDEATSSIDNATEEVILSSIQQNFKDCTMITIAHRLKTIIQSDKILFMENGEVAEYDAPKVLLNQKNGKFYNLWQEYTNSMSE